MSRRSLRLGWLLLGALSLSFTGASALLAADAVAVSTPVQVRSVGPILVTVSDMDRSVDFYSRVLTFDKTSDTELACDDVEHFFGVFGSRVRIVRMQLGGESIELAQFIAPRDRAIPVDSCSNDVEFASSGPQRLPDWNKSAAGIQAFYFKDPDEHPLEILQFPADKGESKWHRVSSRLFLGIDHTAIVVSDTDASLKFYRDLLGLRVAGESENYGTEQEHLSNVFGAHLRITSLRAPSGPGIELLEYLSPRDGRPIPSDERANDLVHRQTELEIGDADAAIAPIRSLHVPFISNGAVSLRDAGIGFAQGFVVRDPDGHAVGLIQDSKSN